MKNKSLEEIEKSTKNFLSASEAAAVLGISPSTLRKKADEYSVMTYVLDSKDFVFTGGEFGIESSIIALLGYVIVTLAAICMIKKKAKV